MLVLALWLLFQAINSGNGGPTREGIVNEAFITRDEFTKLMNELHVKVRKMQAEVRELEVSLLEQNDSNLALKNRVLELEVDNVVMKMRLTHMEKNCKTTKDKHEHLRHKTAHSLPLSRKHILELFNGSSSSGSKQQNGPMQSKLDSNAVIIDNQTTLSSRIFYVAYDRNNPRIQPRIRKEQVAIKDISNDIYSRQITEPNENVAFSVFIDHDDLTSLVQREVIKFNGVTLNDGNGYDVNTGIFTAPRGGLYLFSFFIEDYHDQDLWVELFQDHVIRAQAVVEPYSETQNTMGGNTVLFHVKEGSRIWLAIYRGDRVQKLLSTFSGVLLH